MGGRGGRGGQEEAKARTRPLTRGALGLNGPPPQSPFAQDHVAAAPPDLEDAPEQNLLGRRLRPLRDRPRHRGPPRGRRPGRLFLPAALQGAHAAAAPPPGHGGPAGWAGARGRGGGRFGEEGKSGGAQSRLEPRPALPGQPHAGLGPRRGRGRRAGPPDRVRHRSLPASLSGPCHSEYTKPNTQTKKRQAQEEE